MKTTWLAHKWIWSAVVVALFAAGCGELLPTPNTTDTGSTTNTGNCTYKRYYFNKTSRSIRGNCTLKEGVLTFFYEGKKHEELNMIGRRIISYGDDGNEIGDYPVTIEHPSSKTWIYYTFGRDNREEIILDTAPINTPDIADPTDCTYRNYYTNVLNYSIRGNCTLSEGVLTFFYGGKEREKLDTMHSKSTTYYLDGGDSTYTVTIEHIPDSKTWIYYIFMRDNREEIILD